MPSDLDFKINDAEWKKLDRFLAQFPGKVAAVLPAAQKKILKPIWMAARRLVVRRSGRLAKSLGSAVRKYRTGGVVYSIAGPRTGFRDKETGENPVKIAHLVEYGTKAHLVGGKEHPGAKAQPFMRPAWDQHKHSVMPALGRAIVAGVDKAAAKLAWR